VNASCRPITAIEQLTGNKNWVPLLDTPPFPSWVSGHSTFSASAAVILDILVVRGQMPVYVKSESVPDHTRKFDSAWSAAREAGMSRIYGGIHFQDDNVDGLKLGRLIGCTILQKNGYSCPQ
jgi:membrane-associated phospholipid phosphatase